MKIMLEKKDLTPVVSSAARGASNNDIMPILKGMMLEAKEGKLIATALDLEVGIKVSTSEVQLDEEGCVLVNAKNFNDLVAKLPDEVITLQTKDNRLEVKYGRSRCHLKTLDTASWSGWPDREYREKFVIPQEKLKTALQHTIFACAKEHFRNIFKGVLIDVQPEAGEIRFVGTDTHRMAYYRCPIENLAEPFNVVIPAKAAGELTRHLMGPDPINIGMNGNNIIFSSDDFEMYSRTIDGQYPNYLQVIPKDASQYIEFNPEELRGCVERINALPRDDKKNIMPIKFKCGEELIVTGTSEEAGEIKETCSLVTSLKKDDSLDIAFNITYVYDALKTMPDKCKLSFSGEISPAILQSSPEYLMVLVPLRMAG